MAFEGRTNLKYEIVPSKIIHIAPLARAMREEAAESLQNFGANPRRSLHHAFISSHFCRTIVEEGKPIAMFGLHGTMLGDTAMVWLVLTKRAVAASFRVALEARRQLREMERLYPMISTLILKDDEAAVRFALVLGFREQDNQFEGLIAMTWKRAA